MGFPEFLAMIFDNLFQVFFPNKIRSNYQGRITTTTSTTTVVLRLADGTIQKHTKERHLGVGSRMKSGGLLSGREREY